MMRQTPVRLQQSPYAGLQEFSGRGMKIEGLCSVSVDVQGDRQPDHACAGIIMDILMPSLFGLRCVLGPAGTLPNMNLIGMLADHAGIDIWSMVPSLVDELGETPDVLDKMRSSKFICASGGGSRLASTWLLSKSPVTDIDL